MAEPKNDRNQPRQDAPLSTRSLWPYVRSAQFNRQLDEAQQNFESKRSDRLTPGALLDSFDSNLRKIFIPKRSAFGNSAICKWGPEQFHHHGAAHSHRSEFWQAAYFHGCLKDSKERLPAPSVFYLLRVFAISRGTALRLQDPARSRTRHPRPYRRLLVLDPASVLV